MLRRTFGVIGFNNNSELSTLLLNMNGIAMAANFIKYIFWFAQPDVIINVDEKSTERVFYSTFHELGHASHFKKVGSSYWVKYINYIITYGSYGDGHGKNAGVCGVGEMWGYYIGARLAEEEFDTTRFYRDSQDGWIPIGINTTVVDEADYTISDIYSCLNSNVTTIPRLNAEYNARIGKDIETVNQIFENYGY